MPQLLCFWLEIFAGQNRSAFTQNRGQRRRGQRICGLLSYGASLPNAKHEYLFNIATSLKFEELTIGIGKSRTMTSVRKSEIEKPSRATDVLKQWAVEASNDSQYTEGWDPQIKR